MTSASARMLHARARREQDSGEIADEVLAADRFLFDTELRAIRGRNFFHQVVARGGFHPLRAKTKREQQLAFFERDAMTDRAKHARGAKAVVATLRRELAAVRERTRFTNDERVRDEIAEAATAAVDERDDRADSVEARREIDRATDV